MTYLLDPVVQRRLRAFQFGDTTQYIASAASTTEVLLGEIQRLQAKVQQLELELNTVRAEAVIAKCLNKVKTKTPEITFPAIKRKIQA